MEFLMTYGWAILVVLVAIGALAYFGVLNPSNVLPSSCTIAPGIGCDDFVVNTDSVTLVMQNGFGENLLNVGLKVDGCGRTEDFNWSDGTKLNGTFNVKVSACTNGAVGDRFKQNIVINYTTKAGLLHTVSGTITGRVQ